MKIEPIMVAVVTGCVVVMSKWSQGKTPSVDNAIGVAGVALGLTALRMTNEKLSAGFGALILVSVFSVYLPPLVKGLGFGAPPAGGSMKTPTPGSGWQRSRGGFNDTDGAGKGGMV